MAEKLCKQNKQKSKGFAKLLFIVHFDLIISVYPP